MYLYFKRNIEVCLELDEIFNLVHKNENNAHIITNTKSVVIEKKLNDETKFIIIKINL